MKSSRYVVVLLLNLYFIALASAQYPMQWSTFKDLAQPSPEFPDKALPAYGGGYFICGRDSGSTILAKFDDAGALLWTRAIEGQDGDISANSTGVALVGRVDNYLGVNAYFSSAVALERYDLQGNLIWSKQIHFDQSSPVCKVAMDPAGNVFMEEQDGRLLKFAAANGSQLWSVAVPQSSNTVAIEADAAGSIYAAIDDLNVAKLFKFSGAGAPLWNKVYNTGDQPRLKLDSAGNVFFVFSSSGTLGYKFDPNGNVLATFAATEPGYVKKLDIAPSGALIVSGLQPGQMSMSRFAANGTFQWSKEFFNEDGAVAFDSQENVLASSGFRLYKFDTAGSQLWFLQTPAASGPGQSVIVDGSDRAFLLYPSSGLLSSPDFGVAMVNPNATLAWSHSFDAHKSYDMTVDSVTDVAGNTYVASQVYSGAAPGALAKFTSGGGVSWSRVLPSMAGNMNVVGPRLTPDGGILIGESLYDGFERTSFGLSIYKYDAAGNVVWSWSNNASKMALLDLAVGTDGSVVASTSHYVFPYGVPTSNLRVIKLSSDGTLAWMADRSDTASNYVPSAKIAIDPTGPIYVTYPTESGPNYTDHPTLTKFSGAGQILWSQTPPDIVENDPYGNGDGLVLDQAGNAYLLGNYFSSTGLSKYDPNGNLLWSNPILHVYKKAILGIDGQGSLFVGGFDQATWEDGEGPEVIRFDSNGNQVWVRELAAGADVEYPIRMLPDGAGGAYLGAVTRGGSPDQSSVVAKILPNGALAFPGSGGLFVNGYIYRNGTDSDYGFAGLGFDVAGNIYAAGSGYAPTGSYDLNVVRYAASNSAYLGQSVPSTMVAGQTYAVNSTFQNTGFNGWSTAGGYKMGLVNGSTWGVAGVAFAAGETVAPGQSRKFSYNVYAPTTPGTYGLQSKMYRNGSSFGVASPNTGVTVVMAADAARYVSQSEPTNVAAGSTFTVKVTMRNVGSNTWTLAGGYGLAPAPTYPAWNVGTVPLAGGDSIANGSDKVFTFSAQAPLTPGTYNIRFQMKKGSTFFGDRTTVKSVTVT